MNNTVGKSPTSIFIWNLSLTTHKTLLYNFSLGMIVLEALFFCFLLIILIYIFAIIRKKYIKRNRPYIIIDEDKNFL